MAKLNNIAVLLDFRLQFQTERENVNDFKRCFAISVGNVKSLKGGSTLFWVILRKDCKVAQTISFS